MAILRLRLPYVVFVGALCLLLVRQCQSESYSAGNFEDKLGIAYEFKIHIDAGREDCFYQYIQPGSSLYVAFQVILILTYLTRHQNFSLFIVILHQVILLILMGLLLIQFGVSVKNFEEHYSYYCFANH